MAENFSPNLYADLEKILEVCAVCQREVKEHHHFPVSLPYDDCVFNHMVLLDLMKLNRKNVIQIFDRDKKFEGARFLFSESTGVIWETFMCI